eukprot:TRINITY_DN693_c0_g1_i1.p1 TRINITY_DN693_c0_g1~~TRINITY_DN693_c0_g1_i1.p1  ORF type:complete len:444 (+),score=113.13 TRINITY_DN693_c0_g1_i1:39-1370(+)
MEAWFTSSESVTLLWQTWQTTDSWSYTAALGLVFALAVANEWVSAVRITLASSLAPSKQRQTLLRDPSDVSDDLEDSKRLTHLAITALFFVSTVLSMFLMLIVMTFNTGIFLAILLGVAAGHYGFSAGRPWASSFSVTAAVLSIAVYSWFAYSYMFLSRKVALGASHAHKHDAGAQHDVVDHDLIDWHLILMTTSVVVLGGLGLVSHRFSGPKDQRITIHAVLQLVALAAGWGGFAAVNKFIDDSEKEHLTSLHSVLGLAVLIGMSALSLSGLAMRFVHLPNILTIRSAHRAAGLGVFVSAIVAVVLGFQLDQTVHAALGECGQNCTARNWDSALGIFVLVPLVAVLVAVAVPKSLAQRVSALPHRTRQLFEVQMSCQACVDQINVAVAALAGVESVECNLGQGQVTVVGTVSQQDVLECMETIGRLATFIQSEELAEVSKAR